MWKIVDNLKLPLFFVVLCAAALAVQLLGNDFAAGYGANLLAEFIGAVVTVYGIDYLIKRREERRLLPVRASSYEDVRVMTHWALNLWREAFIASVRGPRSTSWDELFSEDALSNILVSLDVMKPANTIPKQTWATYLDHEMERIHSHAEKVLERHAAWLDPEVHNAVYTLVYYKHHKITHFQALDGHMGTPRPTNLGSHFPVIREWFDVVLTLHKWTLKTHPYLTKNGITNIHAPYQFTVMEEKANPPAGFDEGVLESQVQAFTEWQKQQEAQPGRVGT